MLKRAIVRNAEWECPRCRTRHPFRFWHSNRECMEWLMARLESLERYREEEIRAKRSAAPGSFSENILSALRDSMHRLSTRVTTLEEDAKAKPRKR